MSKIGLIIEREYMTRVKQKSFLLTTILVPIVIIAFYAIIIVVSISGDSKTQKVAILDNAGLFDGKIEPGKDEKTTYDFIRDETEQSYKAKYLQDGYNVFVFVPEITGSQPGPVRVHSQSSVNLSMKSSLERKINSAIERKRLIAADIDPDIYQKIKSDVRIENIIDAGEGKEKRSNAGITFAVAFAGGILIYMILMIYGTMVMRGVMEEKTNRIAEVVVSSVKPFQLMLGKIIGIGAVGLTQFAIWIVLMGALQFVVPLIFPQVMPKAPSAEEVNAAMSQAGSSGIASAIEGLRSLPIGLILFCFLFYFIGGYLVYAALFAAIGSVVSEDQQEAQQLVFPVIMPLILGFVIMTRAVNDPDGSLSVFGSMFPLTSPIVMMGRVTYGVPWWQLAISMALLILTFLFFTWLTAKIYRTGILLYGKKVSWKEIWKWMVRKG